MKSLFQLLREEDEAIRDYEIYQNGYEYFSKIDVSEHVALEYKKKANIVKGEVASVRKEICEYLRTIGILGKEITDDKKRES